jgi:hypothetical protein
MTLSEYTFQLYRILVPKFIRKKILAKTLPVAILKYYASRPEVPSKEIAGVLDYLRKNPMTIFPYDFEKEYTAEEVKVFMDEACGLRYVIHEGKRLYFKKRWSKRKIRELYNLLSKEQDFRSPHRYLTENYQFEKDELLIDVGAAEGNFALSNVENASRVILFEADKEWIEPLQATFKPWKDKVEIINKFVSDTTRSGHIKLDDFITANGTRVFLKVDVEGAESKLLKGTQRFLSQQKQLKVVICTYHKQDDVKEFSSFLIQLGFSVTASDGYMLYYLDKKIKAPFFRRGLIRAEKK